MSTVTFNGGDLAAFINARKPGDLVLCTAGGTLSTPITKAAVAAAPIIVDGKGHVFVGRWDFRGSAGFIEVHHYGHKDFTPLAAGHQQSGAFGGHDCYLHDFDFSNNHTKIGYEVINDSVYGVGRNNRFERGRVHAVGRMPYGVTNNDHGFYDVGYGTQYTDMLIYDCSDRALQLRGAKGAHAQYITWANCGEGLIFGDIGATSCIVENFIGVNRQVHSRYLIEEYDPNGNDHSNIVRNGFVWNSDGGAPIGPHHSFTPVGVQKINPRLGLDYMPVAGSPAAGDGCRYPPPVYF